MSEAKLVDVLNGNELRILEHDGWVYFEALGKHNGQPVATAIRINRDIAMLVLRRMVLS